MSGCRFIFIVYNRSFVSFCKLSTRSSSYAQTFCCPYPIQPVEFTSEDAELLFGPDADYKAAFEELDTDEDGEVRSN